MNKVPFQLSKVLVLLSLSLFGTLQVIAGEWHVFLLIGQSNMAGRAQIQPQDTELIEQVWLWNIGEQKWQAAIPPYNRFSPSRKPMKLQRLNMGPSFVQAYLKRHPGVEVGVVCAARGGTSIRIWSKQSQDSYALYDHAVKATQQALATGGKLKGILWHQGESDSSRSDSYLKRLNELVSNLRTDLKAPDVPFVCGQIGAWKEGNAQFNRQLTTVVDIIPNSICIHSSELTSSDGSHFDSRSIRELGKRYDAGLAKLESMSE